jgi:hypothetical protein
MSHKKEKDSRHPLVVLAQSLFYSAKGVFYRIYYKSHKVPIVVFYSYLWNNNKQLVIKTFLWNYLVPILVEILPYELHRKLSELMS